MLHHFRTRIDEVLDTDGIAKAIGERKSFELQCLRLVSYRDNYCERRL
jgi:hypothetical protein